MGHLVQLLHVRWRSPDGIMWTRPTEHTYAGVDAQGGIRLCGSALWGYSYFKPPKLDILPPWMLPEVGMEVDDRPQGD